MAENEEKRPEMDDNGAERHVPEGEEIEVTVETGQREAPAGDAEQDPGEADTGAGFGPPGDGDPSGAGEENLEHLVATLQEDLAAARDLALRAQADAQNVKRRAAQDVEKARKFALEGFSKELLPVVDNLERALESIDTENESLKPITEGVQLTLKSFLDALQKFHIEQLDPLGEPFDPNLHQAMSMVENPDVEPNTVIAVMQKGYVLNGRLVRPAMVMVSKGT